MRYFRRRWDESRGDEHDNWGTSVWYFSVADDGYPERQLTICAKGQLLAYDRDHLNDEYGGLGDQPLDLKEFEAFEIARDEFETVWRDSRPINR